MRCILDNLFEQVWNQEVDKKIPWNAEHYEEIRQFLDILSTPDDTAYVNYGAWTPPYFPIQWFTPYQWWKPEEYDGKPYYKRKFYRETGTQKV